MPIFHWYNCHLLPFQRTLTRYLCLFFTGTSNANPKTEPLPYLLPWKSEKSTGTERLPSSLVFVPFVLRGESVTAVEFVCFDFDGEYLSPLFPRVSTACSSEPASATSYEQLFHQYVFSFAGARHRLTPPCLGRESFTASPESLALGECW